MVNSVDFQKEYKDTNSLFQVRIELTTKCNCRCKHCYIEDYNEYGLKTEEIFRMLVKMREAGVYIVEFTGGEIFTRPDIMEIISYARKLKFSVSLMTNLSLFTDEIINQLDELAVTGISTTLFSMSDKINDKITGKKKSASVVIENLKKLSKTSMKIEVKTVLMQENLNEYKEIQKFCEEYGFDYLATDGLFPRKSGSNIPREFTISCEQMKTNLYELDLIRYGKVYKEEKKSDRPICGEVKYGLAIGADGECYPCNLFFHKLGNIKDYQYDVSLVWNHPFLQKLRRLTWKDLSKCHNCNKSQYCIRCTGIVDLVKGDMFDSDPYMCRTAEIRKSLEDNNYI